jgi:hypothetical protein
MQTIHADIPFKHYLHTACVHTPQLYMTLRDPNTFLHFV